MRSCCSRHGSTGCATGANPLTYFVDALRGLMIEGGRSVYGFAWDCMVLLGVFLALLFIAVRAYPRLVR